MAGELDALADQILAKVYASPLPPPSITNGAVGDDDDLDGIDWKDWEAFWAKEQLEHDWLVEPVVANSRATAIYSKAKLGKSLLALEIAAGVATGRAVLDRPESGPESVIYIDMEMTDDDLRERLEAMGYSAADDLSRLHYAQMPALDDLDTDRGGLELYKACERWEPVLVVIDTMARVVRGEENSADTYRNFYLHTGRHLKRLGIALLRLDHEGKSESGGARGSSAKDEDVDVVFQLTMPGAQQVKLRRTRSRVGWVPESVELDRIEDPYLRHVAPLLGSWPAGTADCARDLDDCGVLLDSTVRNALHVLRCSGNTRRTNVVTAALRFRRVTPGNASENSSLDQDF